MMIKTNSVSYALHEVRKEFLVMGHIIDRQEWQGMRDDRPQAKVFEVTDVVFRVNVPQSREEWARECEPNLPWAEDHFHERVSGEPLNPGEEYKNWPWYEQGVEEHKPDGKFSHTYMERFWPKWAPENGLEDHANYGIRYPYGDLETLVDLLRSRPYTRQAYLPIWFPEDLHAAMEPERVPCTLGYHFQAVVDVTRSGDKPVIKMSYFMRSCDWFRYLRDDLYMAGRLLQWVADRVDMRPGSLAMHIDNLHIFDSEGPRLRKEHADAEKERLSRAF